MIRTIRLAFLVLALAPGLALAQSQPGPDAYPEWDALSQDQRDALLAPLRERWNANPAERPRMYERARRWAAMPRAQRDRARHGMQRWERMSPQERAEARALFQVLRTMDPQQRKAFMAEWRDKTPAQRAEWFRAHPAPARPAPRGGE